jgi:hypothetical protein
MAAVARRLLLRKHLVEALTIAAEFGHKRLMQWLLAYGAEPVEDYSMENRGNVTVSDF